MEVLCVLLFTFLPVHKQIQRIKNRYTLCYSIILNLSHKIPTKHLEVRTKVALALLLHLKCSIPVCKTHFKLNQIKSAVDLI